MLSRPDPLLRSFFRSENSCNRLRLAALRVQCGPLRCACRDQEDACSHIIPGSAVGEGSIQEFMTALSSTPDCGANAAAAERQNAGLYY